MLKKCLKCSYRKPVLTKLFALHKFCLIPLPYKPTHSQSINFQLMPSCQNSFEVIRKTVEEVFLTTYISENNDNKLYLRAMHIIPVSPLKVSFES